MSNVENEEENPQEPNIEMAYKKVAIDSQETGNMKKQHPDDLNNIDDITINEEDAEEGIKNKLMFEEKDISLLQLLFHLSLPLDKFLMVVGLIGAMGSGVAFPIIVRVA